jgi:hypothetical protein
MFCVDKLNPDGEVTFNVIWYHPSVNVYVGFCCVLKTPLVEFSKYPTYDQFQFVTAGYAVDVSVNDTVCGETPQY